MKIFWAKFAKNELVNIYKYYKTNANKFIADKIKSDIFRTVRQLILYPKSGQIEYSLNHLGECHRYLVCGNYKIIYMIVNEGILITDIFDSRQDPIKINDTKR